MKNVFFLLFVLFPMLLYAQKVMHLPAMETYMKLHTGMSVTEASAIIDHQWSDKYVSDTGPMVGYTIGTPNDTAPVPGSLRLLLYYMGNELASKEMRLSTSLYNTRTTLDSMKLKLIKAYGEPSIDSNVTGMGLTGKAKLYSWIFKASDTKNIYRVDLAAYKISMRSDYTVMVAVYTYQYNQMIPPRNYLHY